MRNAVAVTLVVLAGLLLNGTVQAADPPRTTITFKDLDCPSCAKKLAARLGQVPGVAAVKTDLETKTATITPRPNQQPLPRALWETAEKAGFEPVKLEGPAGTFTDRPK
ncbi:MAG TPA: heavy metal-associated domain-containing protein [Gemmataceae bacterium]|nr:heavy metal-associated domain-containing protein [Gemmataceae bacterium]